MKLRQQDLQYSDTYKAFRQLPAGAHGDVMRFFERNEQDIINLDVFEYVTLLAAYTNALFETGDHRAHLRYAKMLIEQSIFNNIQYIDDEDVYQRTLFQKAASHYNLNQTTKAEYILKELLKMSPDNALVRAFLVKIYINQRPNFIALARAFCVLCCLVAAAISVLEIFIISPFFSKYALLARTAWPLVLTVGVATWAVAELGRWFFATQKVRRFVRSSRMMKKTT